MEKCVTNIGAILACDLNYGIGKNGKLPWPNIPEDMRWFRRKTTNGVVIMGRKTFESIGSVPLLNRINYVITSQEYEDIPNTYFYDLRTLSIEQFLSALRERYEDKTIWIIGGAEIYNQFIPYCDHICLTKIKHEYDCDTFVDKELIKSFPTFLLSQDYEDFSLTVWSK
jgi:dihydrofolate reductase